MTAIAYFRESPPNEPLFEKIAQDLECQGYSIRHGALPLAMTQSLYDYQKAEANKHKFEEAGIGRGDDFLKTDFVRKDEICWINGDSPVGQDWLNWAGQLQVHLNRRLFLGLFSFESHFAHYAPGAFYKKHYDAFRGEANRVLSVVVYLNSDWTQKEGGELVLYQGDSDQEGIKVTPLFGTIVVFLSEEFPHEVLPACRDRYSVAGWFRVNSSMANRIDPPR